MQIFLLIENKEVSILAVAYIHPQNDFPEGTHAYCEGVNTGLSALPCFGNSPRFAKSRSRNKKPKSYSVFREFPALFQKSFPKQKVQILLRASVFREFPALFQKSFPKQ